MSFLVTAAATATTTAIVGGTAATTVGAALAGGSIGAGLAGAAAGAATAGAMGAGIGAISSAAQGQDVGKGALMGAASGVVTAGVAGGLSAAGAGPLVAGTVGGAAGGAAGAATGGEDVGKGAMIGGATGAVTSGVGELAGAVGPPPNASGEFGTIKPDFSNVGAVHDPGALDSLAKGATDLTGSSITGGQLSGGLKALTAGALTDYAGHSIVNADEAAKKAEQQNAQGAIDFANQNQAGMANLKGLGFGSPSGPLSSLSGIGKATGGLTALAHGGQIPLKDGAYIIPADVVSALGNGSSKAGAEFLRHLMMEVRKEAVNIQGLGAAKKHVS